MSKWETFTYLNNLYSCYNHFCSLLLLYNTIFTIKLCFPLFSCNVFCALSFFYLWFIMFCCVMGRQVPMREDEAVRPGGDERVKRVNINNNLFGNHMQKSVYDWIHHFEKNTETFWSTDNWHIFQNCSLLRVSKMLVIGGFCNCVSARG